MTISIKPRTEELKELGEVCYFHLATLGEKYAGFGSWSFPNGSPCKFCGLAQRLNPKFVPGNTEHLMEYYKEF